MPPRLLWVSALNIPELRHALCLGCERGEPAHLSVGHLGTGPRATVLRKHLPPGFRPLSPALPSAFLGTVADPASPTDAGRTCPLLAYLRVSLRLLTFSWPHVFGTGLLCWPRVSLSDPLSLRPLCPFLLLGSFLFQTLLEQLAEFPNGPVSLVCFSSPVLAVTSESDHP